MKLAVLFLCAFIGGDTNYVQDSKLSESTCKYNICDSDNPEININFINIVEEDVYEC